MRVGFVLLAALGVAAAIASQTLTLLVIPPIGAIPDGMTVLIQRTGQLQMIDSVDAMCDRTGAGVSPLCRSMAITAAQPERIIARLPYSRQLYLFSTGGRDFSGR
jgi:hypothetical protein